MLLQFRIVFFFFLIPLVISISNQEDLSISTYSRISCLVLKPDKQFISNGIQENSLMSYQTFASPNLTVDLCFRLCRRWIILMNSNHTTCLCLYTMNELYEINEHLGEVLPVNNCTSNALRMYSLTKDSYLLPSPTPNDDWSFDGCYYLHGVQTYHANLSLNVQNYTQAMDSCRKHCQQIRGPSYFSFFLSLKKLCYCLPIKLPSSITTTAVRKPLVHCSFLPYLKKGFNNTLNYSEINSDTVVKIIVQRYCLASFIFDRYLYRCLKIVLLNSFNSYAKITLNETCSPVLVKTSEQWSYLVSLSPSSRSRIFIWIDRNSTYLFDDLFKGKISSLASNNVCVVIDRTQSSPYDLISCSTIQSPGYVLCTQKPIEPVSSDHSEFHSIPPIPIVPNITCPTDFILFDNRCYYIDTSFVYSIRHGEQLCSGKYESSSLVRLHSHQWGNANSTRFLGRTLDDVLLELFYYQLEKKLIVETKNNTNAKHWLRLLVGDQNTNNECVLRYFIRSSGSFTILHRCTEGGHPVCQCQPILIKETTNEPSETEVKTESTTTSTEISVPIILNGTADEDLVNNETNTDYTSDYQNKTVRQKENLRSNYRSLLKIIIAPLLAFFVLLLIGMFFLVRYIRRSRGSYSTRTRTGIKRSSTTTATANETSRIPAVLYTRLKPPPPSIIIDEDITNTFDNSIINDDKVHLLPAAIHPASLHKTTITENDEEEEPLYATLKSPNDN